MNDDLGDGSTLVSLYSALPSMSVDDFKQENDFDRIRKQRQLLGRKGSVMKHGDMATWHLLAES